MSIFLDGILKQVFDNNQLCIEPDVLAWTLFIDVYCLEGSFVDFFLKPLLIFKTMET